MNSAQAVMLLNRASPTLSRIVGRGGLRFAKHRPHILFGVGIAAVTTSTVMACRATLRLEETLEEIQNDVNNVREPARDNYPVEETGRDHAYVYTKAVVKLARLYGPSLAVGLAGVGCLSGAHLDLTRRNAALVAAYTSLQAAFDNYRDRVRGELGADRELVLYSGVVNELNEIERSNTAVVFDSTNVNWEGDPEINRIFLTIQQNYLNDLLRARGHVMLNEVYDRLGFDHTRAGSVVGWVLDPAGNNWIDFGLYDNHNNLFLDGSENVVLLNFNTMGLVFHLIEEYK